MKTNGFKSNIALGIWDLGYFGTSLQKWMLGTWGWHRSPLTSLDTSIQLLLCHYNLAIRLLWHLEHSLHCLDIENEWHQMKVISGCQFLEICEISTRTQTIEIVSAFINKNKLSAAFLGRFRFSHSQLLNQNEEWEVKVFKGAVTLSWA